MQTEKERIDELIKETLSQEEAKFYDNLEEQDLFGKLEDIHKGKLGWLIGLMNVMQLVFLGLLIYCVVQFFKVEATNDLIKWAAGGFCCVLAMAQIKLFVWMQMNKNDILRELKRLELQVSGIAHKLDK
ncbi:MAG: DUF6768 family protein [Aurantibacter sp.]